MPHLRDIAGRVLARVPFIARLQAELAAARAELAAERAAHNQTRAAVATHVSQFARGLSDVLALPQEKR